jgi:hypothetical protein
MQSAICPVCGRNNIIFLYSACPLSLGGRAFRCLHCGELFFVKGDRAVCDLGEGDDEHVS